MKNHKDEFGVKQMSHFSRSPWWTGLVFVLPLLIMMQLASAAPSAPAAAPGTAKFDHSKTGFILSGAHIAARCASCHVDSVFKGTPRDCASCHVAGNRMGAQSKSTRHVATAAPCERCHQNTAWTPVTFNHVGVAPGSCLTCHNGTTANGKPNGHISTADSCDTCHKTLNWTQLVAGGMPANHLPTTQPCLTCHSAGYGPNSGVMKHAGIVAGCANCHNGRSFTGVSPVAKPVNHLPTNMPCESCHSSSNFMSFAGTLMKHTGIVSGCASCHSGQTFAVGVKPRSKADAPATHMTTSLDCSGCHTSTTTFLVANLTTPPLGHLPTTQPCSTCHSAGYGSGSGVMTHTAILSNCAQCHNGQVFTGVTPMSKPVNHLPTSKSCETCHSPGSTSTGGFAAAGMNHTGIVSGCTNCHNGQAFAGISPVPKPPTHLPTSMSCETCHSSTVLFSGAGMNHAGIVNGCATCHSGTTTFAVGMVPMSKPSGHITYTPANKPCEDCHKSTASFLTAAAVLPANHLPTTQPCSICHISGFGANSGVMNHTGIGSGCTTCHNGQVFTGVTPMAKPVNHLPTSMACETCHSPGSASTGGFAGAAMKHTGIVGGCTTCHNGQTFAGVSPVPKPVNHLPTSLPCETCHSSSNFTTFSGTLMKHTGIVSGCANCHNGQTFAVGMTPVSKANKPGHLVTTAPCEGCHTSTVSFAVATGGTKPANHLPTTAACSVCHSAASFYPGVMNHTGIVSGCTTCHNGQVFAGVTPKSKPVNHLPTSMACETCHTTANTNPGGFAGGLMKHTGIVGGCTNCHNGQAFAGITPKTKSANHIPYAANLLGGAGMGCEFCHSRTVFTAFTTGLVSSTILHNGSQGKGSGQCTGCHLQGTTYIGVQGRKSLTHEKTGHTDCSDSGCHRPLGNEGTAYSSW